MAKPVKMNKVMDTEQSFSEHLIQFVMKHMDYPWNTMAGSSWTAL